MARIGFSREQRLRIKNTMLAIAGAAVITVVLIYAYHVEYVAFDAFYLVVGLSVFWVINFSFLAVILSGYNKHFPDPALSLPQMYWGATTSSLALLFSLNLDPLFYLLMLVTMVFGVFRCSVSAFRSYCTYAILILLAAHLLRHFYIVSAARIVDELIAWFAFAVCAWILSSICTSIVKLRSRLRRKNAELESAIQAKGRFLANMSHEIRTPMGGVLGMLELSLLEKMDDSLRKNLSLAHSSAKGLLAVINDILDYSKMEAGMLSIEYTRFNIRAFLNEIIDSFSANVEAKNVQLLLHIDDATPQSVCCDEGRLRQILNNLIGNAVKFTKAGKIVVSVSARQISDSLALINVCVSDTGVGISEDRLPQMFEAFTQADASTTRMYGGTGLGLAIVKDLTELMGGSVSVESKKGEGSKFSFCIQSRMSEDNIAALCDKHQPARPLASSALQGKKVLVVDDNATNREVASIALKNLKLVVQVAKHGGEALKLLKDSISRNDLYDIIILDCQMPVLDGYQTTSFIREDRSLAPYKESPIIAMTANAMEGDEEKCLQAGMNDYLTKPLELNKLTQMLCRWLLGEDDIARQDDIAKQGDIPKRGDDIQATTTKQAAETEAVWDRQILLETFDGSDALVAQVVSHFLESLVEQERGIKSALAQGDCDAVRVCAHSLSGASANMHANQLCATARRIEKEAKANNLEGVSGLITALEENIKELRATMGAERQAS